jgi:hypothetical protein
MTPERLEEIRIYSSELFAPHRLGDVATVELIEYVDQLTGERDRARDLAVRCGVFTNSYGEEPKPHEHRWSDWNEYGRQCDDCPAFELPRPSAYDMPVGTYIFACDYEGVAGSWIRDSAHPGGWMDETTGKGGIQSGWIEGLFTDGLVTDWRLP